jgi:hypothetical protein
MPSSGIDERLPDGRPALTVMETTIDLVPEIKFSVCHRSPDSSLEMSASKEVLVSEDAKGREPPFNVTLAIPHPSTGEQKYALIDSLL